MTTVGANGLYSSALKKVPAMPLKNSKQHQVNQKKKWSKEELTLLQYTNTKIILTSVGPAYIIGDGKIAITVEAGSRIFASRIAACCFILVGRGTSSSLVHPPLSLKPTTFMEKRILKNWHNYKYLWQQAQYLTVKWKEQIFQYYTSFGHNNHPWLSHIIMCSAKWHRLPWLSTDIDLWCSGSLFLLIFLHINLLDHLASFLCFLLLSCQ